MARRLIQALEQERTRIGRELHDDINQKLAMLSVELEQLLKVKAESENFESFYARFQMTCTLCRTSCTIPFSVGKIQEDQPWLQYLCLWNASKPSDISP